MPQKQQATTTMLKPQAAHPYQVPYSAEQHYTMGPAAHYHTPYLAGGPNGHLQPQHYGAPMPVPFNSGAQTISRSSNLRKHFGAAAAASAGSQTMNPRNFANSIQQVYTTPAGASYEQAYLSAGQPSMTLAMRQPRDRGSIPASMGPSLHYNASGLANTIGHAHSRHYLEQLYAQQQQQQQLVAASNSLVTQHTRFVTSNKPLCRCRVMYLGSSVPHITKNGLHGIQEPLRHLYPEEKFNTNSLRRKAREASTIDISHLSSSLGIDSWLSVWSNGLLLENVDEFGREIKRFFAIESLHYCAAVRFFDTSALGQQPTEPIKQPPPVTMSNQLIDPNNNINGCGDDAITEQENQPLPSGEPETTSGGAIDQDDEQRQEESQKRGGVVRFLPLDAPIFACPGMLDANHPPVFAAIMRRTSGIKVLECHAFICRRDAASNALVRCCTHAYADFLNAKRLSVELGAGPAQLQQKLMSNASGSSSYYTGGESSTTLTARVGGRDNGPRRHSRSSSVGRTTTHNRRASGQYQEVEAIVQQHRRPRHTAKRPAQSLSTSGGTNSQEMTHSEENSLEDEANDYAIISRGSNGGQAAKPSSYQQMRSSRARRHEGSSSTSRRHRERRTKGSSKSLFTDFQPQAQQQVVAPRCTTTGDRKSRDELDRLSHSLDHLQMATTCCSVPGRAPLAHQSDSTGETSAQGENQIKYSIVSGKHKRHSKSMQQLHPPVGPPLGAPPPPPPLPADFDGAGGVVGGGSLSSNRRRKAASYQDIFGAPESAGGSLSRRSSTSRRHRRSRRLARHSRGSSMSSLQDSSLIGSQRKHSAAHRKYSLELSNMSGQVNSGGNYNGIYATCDEVGLDPESAATTGGRTSMLNIQPRVLGPDCCVQQQSANTLRRQSKSRRHSEKREQLALEQQQQHRMMAAYCGQAPPPPLPPHHAHLGHAYSPQPTPIMVPAHPLYATGGYYVPGAALYDSPYLATSPPVVPGATPHLYQQPYQQFGHPAGAPHHPMFQPATISARHSHKQQQQQQHVPLMTVGRIPKSSTAAGGGAGGGTTKSAKSKSQTLATRFRCLSPPVNFFSSSAGETAQPSGGDHQAQRPESGPQLQQVVMATQADLNNNRQSMTSIGSSSTLATSERVSPSQVVSGQPGFLASNSDQQAGPSGPRARPGKRSSSKLSWIKRLSLTLSGGQSVSSSPSGHADTAMARADRLASSMNGPPADERQSEGENNGRSLLSDQASELTSSEPQVQTHDRPAAAGAATQSTSEQPPEASQAKSKRAKRGGLFSGTLTLGRSAKAKTAVKSATAAAAAAASEQS